MDEVTAKFVEITQAYKSLVRLLFYHTSFVHTSPIRLTDPTIRENYERMVTMMAAKKCLWESIPIQFIEGKNNVWVLGLHALSRFQLARSCLEVVVR